MIQNSEIRAIAREKLEGNWGDAALTTFVMVAVAMIANSAFQYGGLFMFQPFGSNVSGVASSGTSLIGTIAVLPITYAYVVMILRMMRGEKMGVMGLFMHYNGKVFFTMLVKQIYVVLWTLLLIIPGIIKSYSYAMTEFIMNDNPELEGNKAIEASMAMMQGNKMKLFLLDLSFIGWIILAMLTFGLGFILLEPYMYAARAAFYEDLKGESQSSGANEQNVGTKSEYVKEY